MKKILFASPLLALSATLANAQETAQNSEVSSATPAAPTRTVSVEQYNSVIKYIKKLSERIKTLESAQPQAGSEETVDLTQMDQKNAPSKATSKNPASPHGQQTFSPNFHVFFDLNLISRPGVTDLTFDSFHSFLLFELAPTPEIQFSFDVNPSPNYFELDYQFAKRFTFRAGKIWIPFDDMSPHNIFGGRVGVSRLTLGDAYLPDLWTDLGVGLKWQMVDSALLNLVSNVYVVNGFRSGGEDYITPGGEYPLFSDLPTSPDNNMDKAIGGRIHGTLFRKIGLGASIYSGRWSDQDDAARGLLIWGADAQVRLGKTEIRSGISSMSADLGYDTVNRGGVYGELGQKFGAQSQFKALLRGGTLQLDDRVTDQNDRTIVGATLLYQPGPIQVSIEHSRDINDEVAKVDKTYTALRLIIAL